MASLNGREVRSDVTAPDGAAREQFSSIGYAGEATLRIAETALAVLPRP